MNSKKNATQIVRLSTSRKGRGGKTVTIVSGLRHCPEALEKLAQNLKYTCGCGGSVKNGEILIQGDQREKISLELKKEGYIVKVA